MPAPECSDLTQCATYWAPEGTDAYGRRTFASPVEIDVRWMEERDERLDKQSSDVQYLTQVNPDRRLVVGGLLWRGTLDEWYGVGSAGSDTGLMQVVRYREVPDVKGQEVRRTAWLGHFKGHPQG